MPQLNLHALIENFTNDIVEITRGVVLKELEQRFGSPSPEPKQRSKKSKKRPRTYRVSDEILSRVERELKRSYSLRSSTTIADTLGVGETTVRTALKTLCAQGRASFRTVGRKILYSAPGLDN